MGSQTTQTPTQSSAARALRVVFHELRAPGLTSARHATLISESLNQLTRTLDEQGPIEVRIRIDGVYLGDECIVLTNPEEDAQAFAIFQHGLRRVAFLPGLEREELEALVEVLSTDPKTLDPREEDLITLLGQHDLASIHFVVIETFVEGEGDSREQVQEIISAGMREKVLGYQASDDSGAASIRLWEADQRLLEGDELTRLAAALPDEGQGGTEGSLDVELGQLRQKLVDGLSRNAAYLPKPAMHLAQRLEPDARARLAQLLAHEIIGDARTREPIAYAEALTAVLKSRDEAALVSGAADVAHELFTPAIEELCLDVLSHEPEAGVEAARALAKSPADRRAVLLPRVTALHPSAGRDRAIAAMCCDDDAGVAEVVRLLPTVDEAGALALVYGLRAAPLGAASLALFRQLSTDSRPRMRARASSWFQFHAPDHAVALLSERLRSGVAVDVFTALWTLLSTRGPLARTLVLAFMQSKEFGSAEFSTKRLSMLAFLEVAGASALPYLHAKAEEMALLGHSRETRAAAVAALAALKDDESRDLLEQLSESRSAGRLVVEQAHTALAQLNSPESSPSASEQLRTELQEMGVWSDLSASRGQNVQEHSSKPASRPTSKFSSHIPGFSVSSSTLSLSPSAPPLARSAPPFATSHELAESDALKAPALPNFHEIPFEPAPQRVESAASSAPPSRTRSSARTLAEQAPASVRTSAITLAEQAPISLRPPAAGGEEQLGSVRPRRRSSKPLHRSEMPQRPLPRGAVIEDRSETLADPRSEPPPASKRAASPVRKPPPDDLAVLLEAYVTELPPAQGEHD